MNNLRQIIGTGVLALASFHAIQAAAAPIFTFTEYSGFTDDVRPANYRDRVTGADNLMPAAGPLYHTMSWVGGRQPQSSLELHSINSPTSLNPDTWTTISTLTHNNLVTPGKFSWSNQDVWGRFILSDADGGVSTVLDSDNLITLGLTETNNKRPCAAPNPIGSICDDYFTFTAGLQDLYFTANDGSAWMATFQFANLINAEQLANVIYTGEGKTSSVDVQVLVTQADGMRRAARVSSVPEPGTLMIFVLGLLGLVALNTRTLQSCKIAVETRRARRRR